MTAKRKFNKAAYDLYDQTAKDKLVALLSERGHTIISSEEDYYADVVSQKEGYTYFNEAEVKTAWSEDWPTHWKEIRIPERKKRLLAKYQDEKGVLNFYVFRKDMKQVWRIKDTQLTDESLKEAFGRYISKGEKFFHIPYTEAELINV
jgi:hypothetical protein